MYAAVKAANPNWQPGQPFDSSILDSVTRELVEIGRASCRERV